MDQVRNACARDSELDRVVTAFNNGVILVDAKGEILWIDAVTRRRVNGGLRDIALPLKRSEGIARDCFVSPVELTISGEPSLVCVIQEATETKEPERDLIAAIHDVMADTSWFTRTIVEKVKALRQGKQTDEPPALDGIDMLSDREREVLGLICEGRSDIEMSTMLHLSPNTIRNHIVSLYRKIGVNRRSAAIIWARERGITGPDAVVPRKRRIAASTARRLDDRSPRPEK